MSQPPGLACSPLAKEVDTRICIKPLCRPVPVDGAVTKKHYADPIDGSRLRAARVTEGRKETDASSVCFVALSWVLDLKDLNISQAFQVAFALHVPAGASSDHFSSIGAVRRGQQVKPRAGGRGRLGRCPEACGP